MLRRLAQVFWWAGIVFFLLGVFLGAAFGRFALNLGHGVLLMLGCWIVAYVVGGGGFLRPPK